MLKGYDRMNILEQLKRDIEQADWSKYVKVIKPEGKEDKQNGQED